MLKKLIKLANHLDSKKLSKEADYLDLIIKKAAEKDDDFDSEDESTEDMFSEESSEEFDQEKTEGKGQKVWVLINDFRGNEEVIGVFSDENIAGGARDNLYMSDRAFGKLEIYEYTIDEYPDYGPY